MKSYRYLAIICVLGIACILTVGCEKMEKPVMDAMDMAMTETDTPAEMDDPLQPVDNPEDALQPVDPPEYDPLQPVDNPEDALQPVDPADMEPDATISISPTEIASLEVGEQFTINVNIDSKVAVVAYEFVLTFDTTALKFVEHSISNYLSENEAEIEDHSLEISMVDDGNLTIAALSFTSTGIGEGILGSVTFEVIEKKASTIVLSDDGVNGPHVPGSDDLLYFLDVAISEDTVVVQE